MRLARALTDNDGGISAKTIKFLLENKIQPL